MAFYDKHGYYSGYCPSCRAVPNMTPREPDLFPSSGVMVERFLLIGCFARSWFRSRDHSRHLSRNVSFLRPDERKVFEPCIKKTYSGQWGFPEQNHVQFYNCQDLKMHSLREYKSETYIHSYYPRNRPWKPIGL
jgi:hypothetical protein